MYKLLSVILLSSFIGLMGGDPRDGGRTSDSAAIARPNSLSKEDVDALSRALRASALVGGDSDSDTEHTEAMKALREAANKKKSSTSIPPTGLDLTGTAGLGDTGTLNAPRK